jgi:hypothetical protein
MFCEASQGVVAIGRADGEVAAEDVERVLGEAHARATLSPNQEILHVFPRGFRLDDQKNLRDPIGLRGVRLEVNALVIGMGSMPSRNASRLFEMAKVNLDFVVAAPLAAAQSVLSEKQKDLGSVMVIIGSGATSLAVFEEGELLHVAALPVGGGHITNDIAIGLRTSIEVAEAVKLSYGHALPGAIDRREEIDLSKFDTNVADTVKSGTTTLEIGVLKIGTGNIVRVGAIEAVVTYTLPTPTTTVVVTGNTAAGENQPGWMFNRDLSTSTPFAFNANAASIGTGSLNVLPIGSNPSDKMIAENFLNTPISDINSISYDFKIGAGGVDTEEEQFYMNVYANFGVSDDLKYYDCRYNIVPTIGSTGGFTTVTFDPTMSYPVTTRAGGNASPFTCPSVPADMNTLSAGSNIRAFALNLGDTSASDLGLDGYFDNVIVNTDSLITTYDFEPAPLPAFVKVTIAKYINDIPATAENTSNASFPMVASWSAENIGTGSGNYTLSSTGFNNPNPYQATTSDMTTGADYSTYEDVATSCTTESPYVLSGYSIGNTLEEAVAGTKSLTVPAFTDLTSDKFIIVWNRTCVPLPVHVSPADNSTRTTAEQTLIDWSDVVNWALPISYIYQASNGMDTNIDGSFTTPVTTPSIPDINI